MCVIRSGLSWRGRGSPTPISPLWGRSFGAEGITIWSEDEVKDGIARAFAVKTKPVVVHCLTSAIQMSAWRRYTRSETLP